MREKSPNSASIKPKSAKMHFLLGGWIAQSVEQQTENLRVGSSILPLTTIFTIFPFLF